MKIHINKIKYGLLVGILSLLIFPACEDLDEDVSGVFVADSFYKSEVDFQLGLTSIYSSLVTKGGRFSFNSGVGLGNMNFFGPHMGGDDIMTHPALSKLAMREIDIFNASATNNQLDKVWSTLYETVYRCNVLIDAASKAELAPEKLAPYIAQARFIRGFTYFYISKIWGDAPFPTDKSYTAVAEIAPSPVADIMNLVIEDVEYAVANIQELSPSTQPSMANVYTAKMLLADVYLKMAGWPFKDESYYAKAAKEALDVINSDKFEMFADFQNNFDIAYHNSSNKEIVFGISHSFTAGKDYANGQLRSTFPPEEGGWPDMMAQIGFFNAFPEGYRKEKTFHTQFIDKNKTYWTESQLKHPFYAKYRSGSSLAKDGSGTDKQNNDRYAVQYRFPYALLTYAEAQTMADGAPNTQSYEFVNMVRRRAMNQDYNTPDPAVDLTPGLGKMEFRNAVIDEKGWEFACEFHRWDDLVRTEKVVEMNYLHRDSQDIPEIERDIANLPKEHFYYMPFQLVEMTRNPLLTQKDGYN